MSFGRWHQWTSSLRPYIKHQPVLEIGFGTGHLHQALAQDGHTLIGIDRSPQMNRITRRRLLAVNLPPNLLRADGLRLPLASGSLGTVAATFPAGYVFGSEFEKEIHRVLKPGGQLVILPYVTISKTSWPARAVHWLYQITGTAPPPEADLSDMLRRSGRYQRFSLKVIEHVTPLASLPILILTKT